MILVEADWMRYGYPDAFKGDPITVVDYTGKILSKTDKDKIKSDSKKGTKHGSY